MDWLPLTAGKTGATSKFTSRLDVMIKSRRMGMFTVCCTSPIANTTLVLAVR